MPAWAFVATCLVIPAVWTLIVARVLRAREVRRTRFTPTREPPSDYSI